MNAARVFHAVRQVFPQLKTLPRLDIVWDEAARWVADVQGKEVIAYVRAGNESIVWVYGMDGMDARFQKIHLK